MIRYINHVIGQSRIKDLRYFGLALLFIALLSAFMAWVIGNITETFSLVGFPYLIVGFYLFFISAIYFPGWTVTGLGGVNAVKISVTTRKYLTIITLFLIFTAIIELIVSIFLHIYLLAVSPYYYYPDILLISGELIFFDLVAAASLTFVFQMRLRASA